MSVFYDLLETKCDNKYCFVLQKKGGWGWNSIGSWGSNVLNQVGKWLLLVPTIRLKFLVWNQSSAERVCRSLIPDGLFHACFALSRPFVKFYKLIILLLQSVWMQSVCSHYSLCCTYLLTLQMLYWAQLSCFVTSQSCGFKCLHSYSNTAGTLIASHQLFSNKTTVAYSQINLWPIDVNRQNCLMQATVNVLRH